MSSLQVMTNGAVTLGINRTRFAPSTTLSDLVFPLIAPFWADADTRGSGAVYYRLTTNNADDEELVRGYIQRAFPQNLPFFPSYVVVVTWSNVGYFEQGSDLVSTFNIHNVRLYLYYRNGVVMFVT